MIELLETLESIKIIVMGLFKMLAISGSCILSGIVVIALKEIVNYNIKE